MKIEVGQIDIDARKRKIFDIIRRGFALYGLLALIIVFAILRLKVFFTLNNVMNIFQQSATVGIVAFGLTFVIIQGGIDLSVGSLVGLASVTSAFVYFQTQSSILTLLATITVGLLFGLFNGLIQVKAKVPSFIVTLGALSIGRGISIVWTQGRAIPIFERNTFFSEIGSVPYIFISSAVVLVFTFILLKFTSFGRYVQAIGDNESAANFVGINVTRTKLLCFLICSMLTAFAGLVLASRMGAGTPKAGEFLELDAIASVVLGGTPLTGGIGGVERTLFGVLLLTVINNGLTLLGVSSDIQMIVKGLVVIIAVTVSLDRSRIGIVK